MFRKLLVTCCMASAMLVAGCFEDVSSTDTLDSTRSSGNLIKNQASALASVSLRAQNAIVSDAQWFASLSGSQEIDLAAVGIANAQTQNIKSAICPVGAGKVVQLTWLDLTHAQQTTDKNGGALASELRTLISATNVGVYGGQSGIKTADGKTISTGSHCNGLGLAANTPVVVFEIDKPARPQQALFKNELRSVACGGTETGTMVQKRTVTYTPEGSIEYGAWQTEDVGKCSQNNTVTTDVAHIQDGASVNVGNLAQQDQDTKTLSKTLADNLKMDCVQASIKGGTTDTQTGSSINNRYYAGKKDVRTTSNSINTCSSITLNAGAPAEFEKTGETAELVEIPCTGPTKKTHETIGSLTGDVNYGAWSGKAVLKRVKENATDGHSSAQKTGLWQPLSLSCSRTNSVTIACNLPAAASCGYAADPANKGLVYEQVFTVNGFKDAARLVPNDPVGSGEWSLSGGSCQWMKTEDVIPTCASNQIAIRGARTQTMKISTTAASGYETSIPTITKQAACITPACGANYFEYTASDGVKKCVPRQCSMYWKRGSANYSSLLGVSEVGGIPVANLIRSDRIKYAVGVGDYGAPPCSNFGVPVAAKDRTNTPLAVGTLDNAITETNTPPVAMTFSSPLACNSSYCPSGSTEYEFMGGVRKCVPNFCQIYWDRGSKRNLIFKLALVPDSTDTLVAKVIIRTTGKAVGHTFHVPYCSAYGIPFGAINAASTPVDIRQFPEPKYN